MTSRTPLNTSRTFNNAPLVINHHQPRTFVPLAPDLPFAPNYEPVPSYISPETSVYTSSHSYSHGNDSSGAGPSNSRPEDEYEADLASIVQLANLSAGNSGYDNSVEGQPIAPNSQDIANKTTSKAPTKRSSTRKEITAAKSARKGPQQRRIRHNEGVDPSTAAQASQAIIDGHLRAPRTRRTYAGYMRRCREWLDEWNANRAESEPDLTGALDELSDRSATCVQLYIAHGVSGKNGTKPLSKDTCDGIKAALKAHFRTTFGNRCYVSETSSIFTRSWPST